MSFEIVRNWAMNSGLLYFVGLFVIIIFYVLKPSNRARFERAARMPLDPE